MSSKYMLLRINPTRASFFSLRLKSFALKTVKRKLNGEILKMQKYGEVPE